MIRRPAAAPSEETLFCLMSPGRFAVAVAVTTRRSVSLTEPLRPRRPLRPPGVLADLLARGGGGLQLRATLFQPRQGLLWSNEALRPVGNSVSSL